MIDDLYALLARFGFIDPLHSPITHMPIGLVTGALIFFLVALIFKRKTLVLTARHASILAFIFVFPTILLGVFDWVHFYHATLYTPIKIKMGLAAVALVLIGAGIILGSEIKLHKISLTIIYAASFITVVGLGYFGSGIIYGRGLEMKKPLQEKAPPAKRTAIDSLTGKKQPGKRDSTIPTKGGFTEGTQEKTSLKKE
jgi:uncharacterized membrane protein